MIINGRNVNRFELLAMALLNEDELDMYYKFTEAFKKEIDRIFEELNKSEG